MAPWGSEKKRRDSKPRPPAETRLDAAPASVATTRPAEELLHELQVYQVELEMQNDELRRTQRALEESRDSYLDLYEFAPVGYFTLDQSGLIARANLTGATLFGVERKKLLRHRFDPYVATHDRERWQRLLIGVLKRGIRQHADLALRRADGSIFHARLDCLRMDTKNRQPEMRIALTDISAEQALAGAHEELRKREALLRIITDNTPNPIYIKDCDSRVLLINAATLRAIGKTEEQTLGRNDAEIFDDPAIGRALMENDRLIMESGVSQAIEEVVPSPQGKRVFLSIKTPYRDAEGKICGILGISHDITERKAAEEALREADLRKNEFLAMLAHELRNPLTPIRNAVHVLGQLGQEEPRIEWARGIIESQVSHLSHMVDDLLDVSRIVRGRISLQKESIVFADLIGRIVASVQPLAEGKGQRLAVRLPEQALWLEGDPVRLCQALFNLLDNAVKYTPEGGRIEIDAQQAGGEIAIRVRDNGSGIPAALLPRIFDLFQQDERTLDRAQGGLGIGLTLAQRLVEMHGGSVTARSEGPGQGSTFTVRLPVGSATPAARPRADQVLPHPVAGTRVLVVDDDPYVADSTAVLLDLEGYEVRVAHAGRDALELIADFQPQVVLLDIGLVGMDGFETAKRLRQLPGGQDLKLIAVTGYGDVETKENALAAGCDHFVIKPMSWKVLSLLLADTANSGEPQ